MISALKRYLEPLVARKGDQYNLVSLKGGKWNVTEEFLKHYIRAVPKYSERCHSGFVFRPLTENEKSMLIFDVDVKVRSEIEVPVKQLIMLADTLIKKLSKEHEGPLQYILSQNKKVILKK